MTFQIQVFPMVGSRIKYFRELHHYKREWLAEKLGIDASQVNRIENDQSEVTVQRLYKIAQLFKISVIDLIEEKFLAVDTLSNIDKYGPVEASYIRFLIHQNEILRMENTKIMEINTSLIENMSSQQVQFKSLMDHLLEIKMQRPKGLLPKKKGGGGIENH